MIDYHALTKQKKKKISEITVTSRCEQNKIHVNKYYDNLNLNISIIPFIHHILSCSIPVKFTY